MGKQHASATIPALAPAAPSAGQSATAVYSISTSSGDIPGSNFARWPVCSGSDVRPNRHICYICTDSSCPRQNRRNQNRYRYRCRYRNRNHNRHESD